MIIKLRDVEPFADNDVDQQAVQSFLRTLNGNEMFEFNSNVKPKSVMFSYATNKLPKWGQISGYLLNVTIDEWDAAFQFLTPEAVYENHIIGKLTIEQGENIQGIKLIAEKLDVQF